MNDRHPSLEFLLDYIHGELPPDQDASVHAHLARCAPCTALHAREAGIREALRGSERFRERDVPYGLDAAILARAADDREPVWRERALAWWRPLAFVPIAAALVLLIAFGVPGRRPSAAVASDGATYIQDHVALAAGTPLESGDATPVTFAADEHDR